MTHFWNPWNWVLFKDFHRGRFLENPWNWRLTRIFKDFSRIFKDHISSSHELKDGFKDFQGFSRLFQGFSRIFKDFSRKKNTGDVKHTPFTIEHCFWHCNLAFFETQVNRESWQCPFMKNSYVYMIMLNLYYNRALAGVLQKHRKQKSEERYTELAALCAARGIYK